MKLLIKNGILIDTKEKTEKRLDVLVEDGLISKLSENISVENIDNIIDANGLYVMPGFIDMHAHFRDPGNLESEDLESGSREAVSGGFTTVCTMSNTVPAVDCVDVINYVNHKAKAVSKINIIQTASLTKGNKGKESVDLEALANNGVLYFCEDGTSMIPSKLLNEIFMEISKYDVLVGTNCEDPEITNDGVINESTTSKTLGLKGIKNITEDAVLARNLCIARHNNIRYHVCHCSTKGSMEIVSMYKSIMKESLSCEVTPHHIYLCDEDIHEDNSNYKTSPPIRGKEDRAALIEGLRNGTIDVIATDHAPHALSYKQLGFRNAPFGTIGMQSAFSICYEALVEKGVLTLAEMVAKMSYNPAMILRLNKGIIEEGRVADICIADLNQRFVLDNNSIKSKSKNSAFINKELHGKIKYTIVNGNIVYSDME